MSINAIPSQGMTISLGDGSSPEVFTAIPEATDITGPDGSVSEIDVTDLSSTAKEFKRGLPDNGSLSFTLLYIPAQTQHAQLRADFNNPVEVARNYRITFTDSPATLWTFFGYVSTFSINNSIDSVTNASVAIRIKGNITEA